MLKSAGWQIIQQDDITGAFCASIERMIAAEAKQSDSLKALRGDEANEIAQANWQYKLQAVADRLILRDFFTVVPAWPSSDSSAWHLRDNSCAAKFATDVRWYGSILLGKFLSEIASYCWVSN